MLISACPEVEPLIVGLYSCWKSIKELILLTILKPIYQLDFKPINTHTISQSCNSNFWQHSHSILHNLDLHTMDVVQQLKQMLQGRYRLPLTVFFHSYLWHQENKMLHGQDESGKKFWTCWTRGFIAWPTRKLMNVRLCSSECKWKFTTSVCRVVTSTGTFVQPLPLFPFSTSRK